ncbi:DinB family protein [[Bacillus] enclensis]|nr:DinB family protein [[Bacillus] enclensis]
MRMWEMNVKDIRKKLEESFEALTFEELNEKPAPGEWSIAQIVLHLAGAETRFMKLALEAAESQQVMEGEEVDLSVFEDKNKKLKAPIDPPEDPQTREQLLTALHTSRRLTDQFLEGHTEDSLSGKTMDHHQFGIMPVWQVLELLGRHEERHIHQIQETKNKISMK